MEIEVSIRHIAIFVPLRTVFVAIGFVLFIGCLFFHFFLLNLRTERLRSSSSISEFNKFAVVLFA